MVALEKEFRLAAEHAYWKKGIKLGKTEAEIQAAIENQVTKDMAKARNLDASGQNEYNLSDVVHGGTKQRDTKSLMA